MIMKQRAYGFTLVEMIVVVSIASILVAIAYASYSDSRAQARDRMRMAQLDQLQVAIELYKDEHGRYPARGCGAAGNQWAGPTGSSTWGRVCADYIVGHATDIDFVPTFIDALPIDPLPRDATSNRNIYYRTDLTGSAYQVLYHQAVESLVTDTQKTNPFSRYASSTCTNVQTNTYAIYSAGAECW